MRRHPEDILTALARDMRAICRTYGSTPAEILTRLERRSQIFDVLNTTVQWNGWSQRELSDFECACFGIASLHVSAVSYSTTNFLFGQEADDAPAIGALLRVASPRLADHFGELLDIVPGYREAKNHEERQRAFATEDEAEEDRWNERISSWTESYIPEPYVSDPDLLLHVEKKFSETTIFWPKN
ncbi:MAG: hypothetical protein QM760_11445 [Nibricoccus sp.]